MEGPISFWGYKEQESNLILPENDDDDINKTQKGYQLSYELYQQMLKKKWVSLIWLNFREKLKVWTLAVYHHKSNHFQNSINDTFAKLNI